MRSQRYGCEVRGLFLEILKTFDKVWHNELIYKFKQDRVSGNLLTLIIDFLEARERTVVLNSQYSSLTSIKAKFPQGSILSPLFLPLLMNFLTT